MELSLSWRGRAGRGQRLTTTLGVLVEGKLRTLGAFVLAGALGCFAFMAQPLQHLDGFELRPSLLLRLLLAVCILVEIWDTRMASALKNRPPPIPPAHPVLPFFFSIAPMSLSSSSSLQKKSAGL